jgi:putative serine protease PepD
MADGGRPHVLPPRPAADVPAAIAPVVADVGHAPAIPPASAAAPLPAAGSPAPATAPLPAPPAPAALPPPPVLTPPSAPKRPATAAADVDAAVAQFRTTMRKKQPLAAEAVLSSIPGDAGGYKDMVRNLGTLRGAQDAAFAALSAAAASGRAAEIAAAAARAAEFPELAPAVAQSHAYVGTVELQWAAALKRVDEAVARHDAAAARAALAEVPTDPAMVTPIVAAKRNAAATAVAALQDAK